MFTLKEINEHDLGTHKHLIIDHFLSLSKEELFCRFFSRMSKENLHDWIDCYQKYPYQHHWFLLMLGEKIIAISQVVYDQAIAEMSFSVLSEFHQKGISKALMNLGINKIKADNKVKTIHVSFLYQNVNMCKLVSRYGFDISVMGNEVQATLQVNQ